MNNLSLKILSILSECVSDGDRVVEIGSASGHISIALLKLNPKLKITLNEIRKVALLRSIFNAWRSGVFPSVASRNLLELGACVSFDLSWNSGLLQCYTPDKQVELINKMLKISKSALFIYPDISLKKSRGHYNQTHNIIGVDGCAEYEVDNKIFGQFNVAKHGVIVESEEFVGFPFHYVKINRA